MSLFGQLQQVMQLWTCKSLLFRNEMKMKFVEYPIFLCFLDVNGVNKPVSRPCPWQDVQQVKASGVAFCAVLQDGRVVTWGHSTGGGDSSMVQVLLRDVKEVQASYFAFAAILADRICPNKSWRLGWFWWVCLQKVWSDKWKSFVQPRFSIAFFIFRREPWMAAMSIFELER